jgi:hypothetical protein
VQVGSGLNTSPTGNPPAVLALAVFDEGSGPVLFATGWFNHAGTLLTGVIARWDGSVWSIVGGGLGGYSPSGRALAVFDDGTGPALFVGGTFDYAPGVTAHYIAKWSGTQWSAVGGALDHYVNALSVFDDGSGPALYVGGYFTHAGALACEHIARWSGTSWSPLGAGIDLSVSTLSVFDDGSGAGPDLYAGGYIATAGGLPANGIAKWNGSAWSALGLGANSIVITGCAFDIGQGPRLLVWGTFFGTGVAGTNIAQWDGSAWSKIGSQTGFGILGSVLALTTFNDGTGTALYAGGQLQQAGALYIQGVAKWDGATWSALVGGTGGPNNVEAFEEFPGATGPTLVAGGSGIASWDGSSWSSLGYGVQGGVAALKTYNSGSGPRLYVGGSFTLASGIATQNLGCWTGTAWLPVGTGVIGAVLALAVFDDGGGPDLYVGGTFTPPTGSSGNYIARWNGSSWSSVGGGMNNHVYSLTVFDDGTGPALYAGGYFTTAGGVPANGIARWNGTTWSALGSGVSAASTPGVLALCSFDDGDGPALYAGGDFTAAGGQPALHLARWNGTSWSSVGSGVNGSVNALAAFDGGTGGGPDLYVGGTFNAAEEIDSRSIAEWRGCAGTFSTFCFGDGSVAPCPCANPGVPGRGCENSAITGGALLVGSGTISPDTVLLSAAGMPPGVSAMLLQGDARLNDSAPFGDGLRCVAGQILRMYVGSAVGGAITEPTAGAPTISARSAALGYPISPGAVRFYQSYYRDPQVGFCPAPAGNLWNVTNGVRIVW